MAATCQDESVEVEQASTMEYAGSTMATDECDQCPSMDDEDVPKLPPDPQKPPDRPPG